MFTKQQILEIQQRLSSLGYKDTDFDIYTDINGEEYVAIVANGENRRIRLQDLDEYLFQKNLPDLDKIRSGAAAGLTAYQKPASGIPRSHLSQNVRLSLNKADALYDNAVTDEEKAYWNNKEDKSNKVVGISSGSTDTEYPTARAVYEFVNNNTLRVRRDTTENWNSAIGFVPAAGEIIIYTDYKKVDRDGVLVDEPGIKIGSGNGYVQDLAFVGEATANELMKHINDATRHISQQERIRWNNKLNVDDEEEVIGETLVFNRN